MKIQKDDSLEPCDSTSRNGECFASCSGHGASVPEVTESLLGNDTGKIRGEAAITVPGGLTVYLRYTESFKTITPVVLPKGVFLESTGEYRFVAVPETEALAEIAKTTPLELEK